MRGYQRGAVRRAAGTGRPGAGPGSAASARGIPAAVTNNGRPEDPRRTGSAWVAVPNLDVAALITAMPNPACVRAPRPGRPPGFRSAEPSATSRPSSLRSSGTARGGGVHAGRTRPAGRAVPGVAPRCVRPGTCAKAGIGQHGRRPRPAGPQVMRVHGGARADVGAPRWFPYREDSRACARHQDRVLAAAHAGSQCNRRRSGSRAPARIGAALHND